MPAVAAVDPSSSLPIGPDPQLAAGFTRLLAMCAVLATSWSCGDESDTTPTVAGVQRLQVSSSRYPEGVLPRSLQRIDPPSTLAEWAADAPKAHIDDESRGLTMGGKGTKRVTVPGPIRAGDQLVVMMSNGGKGTVALELARNGKPAIRATAPVAKGKGAHPVSIDLPHGTRGQDSFDSAALNFDVRGKLTILSIDVIERPQIATLPQAATGFEPVKVGTESRPAVGLGPNDVLQSQVDLRGGASLVLAAANASPTDGPLSLHVEVQGASRSNIVELRLHRDRWTETVVPLPKGTGTLTLAWSLPSATPNALCIVAEPIVLPPSQEDPQTIVVVTSDTHRADHLASTIEDAELDTPHLDALATRGIVFRNAWASSNTTIPSHGALLSGLHPRDTKLLGNYSSLSEDVTTLAEVFASRGFRTAAVTSTWHLEHQYSGLGQGFDVMIRPEEGEARAASSVQAALEVLDSFGSAPAFLWLHLFDAHAPYLPPAHFDRRYYPADADPFDPASPPLDLSGGQLPLWLRGLKDHAFPRAQYRAEIAYMDDALGRFLRQPRVANGVLAFTSDHGEVFARRGVFYEHKGLLPATLHVPLILAWPDVHEAEASSPVDSPVRQMDVGRTLLDLAGLQDVEFPGRNLVQPADDAPRFGLSRRFVSATQGRWHATLALADLSGPNAGVWPARHQVELFDIHVDPECNVDLAGDHRERTVRMRRAMIDWLLNADRTIRASRPNMDLVARANLAALGYADEGGGAGNQLFDPACDCPQCAAFDD